MAAHYVLAACAALAAALAAPRPAAACTTFALAGANGAELAIGKSYDWSMGHGLVMVNRRGVAKQALALTAAEKPARWLARYASLTFNQYGRELPNGGLNEAGLVVEVMWLDSSVLPPPDERPTLNELQLIQYLLDTSATAAEAAEMARRVRVVRSHGLVHYLVCDATGACVVLEHVGGKLLVLAGPRVPVRALTNDTYADSTAFLARHAGFGGTRPLPAGAGSLERFARAAAAVSRDAGAGDLVARAFGVLESVRNGRATQWQIVYEPRRLRVHFRTRDVATVKTLDARRLFAACPSPVPVLDLDTAAAGDATGRVREYTRAANAAIVRRALAPILDRLPRGAFEALVAYPEALPCPAAR
jgi:choloylglycine hydrolase